ADRNRPHRRSGPRAANSHRERTSGREFAPRAALPQYRTVRTKVGAPAVGADLGPRTALCRANPRFWRVHRRNGTIAAPQARCSMSGKVGFISLGCPKALVDSERILTQLRTEGYEVVPTYQDADVVVVNTCGFIDAAKAESLEAIGE